ncbi:MAG: trypsin-like peptidase domain-containing protein [Patescibacteria group bacterium]|jgi:serine protease Do
MEEATIKKSSNKKEESKKVITPEMLKRMVISTLLISFLVGGASGVLFGSWATIDTSASSWIQKNIFKQSSAQTVSNFTSGTTVNGGTVTVQEDSATIEVVKKVDPAVVSIVIYQDASQNPNNINLGPFGGIFNIPDQLQTPQGKQEVGAGTGFIVSSNGIILTNKHVVDTKSATYTVVLNDGTQYEAQVLAADPFNDIALIKIDANNLPSVEIGNSDALQLGQTVVAIGNALGQYNNTVTRGLISGLGRTVTAGDNTGQSETLQNIIQTDAAINLGNSGGPLLNLSGQVIGINTAISQQGQLVGFAIPINQAIKDIQSVETTGKIISPYLGVRYVLINADIAKQNNLSVDYGALIVKGANPSDLAIVPGSPADKAGLTENDIILEINGQKIDQNHSLVSELQKQNPGDSVTLKVLQKGQEKTINVKLEQAPQ